MPKKPPFCRRFFKTICAVHRMEIIMLSLSQAKPITLTVLVLILAASLLLLPHAALQGMREGLELCAVTLIPSLFPFMAISCFVATSSVGQFLSKLFSVLTRRWLRLPPCMGAVVLMSWIGGYPVGGRMMAGLLEDGYITTEQAMRCLKFCICPAPSFAILAVGVGLLGSATAGGVIYACHVFIGLLLGGWYARTAKASPPDAKTPIPTPLSANLALIDSVAYAIQSMLIICGFALLFSTLVSLMQVVGIMATFDNLILAVSQGFVPAGVGSAFLSGTLEITSGLFVSQNLPYYALCVLVPFLLSFGSLSVMLQIAACMRGHKISMSAVMRSRFIHGVLTSVMAAPLLWRIAPAQWVSITTAQPLTEPSTLLSTVGLLCMSAMLLQSLWTYPLPQKIKNTPQNDKN